MIEQNSMKTGSQCPNCIPSDLFIFAKYGFHNLSFQCVQYALYFCLIIENCKLNSVFVNSVFL